MKRLLGEDRSTLGIRLRKRRKALGLTQLATSSRLGVPLHTLTNWETGTNAPQLYYVGKILNFLADEPKEDNPEP
jgi:transcriptional regulator with XRE-family HTH domain